MLPRVHQLLLNFSSSSRVTYGTLKPLFNATERVSRHDKQLWFLKTCAYNGFYPPTIENTRLPGFMQHRRFTKEVESIKSTLFSKLKRHLYAERQLSLDISSNILRELQSRANTTESITSIQSAQKTTYKIASEFHEERLRKRLRWLLRRNGVS